MEEAKYSRTEVAMIVTVLLLVIPYVLMVAKRIHQEWIRLTMVGKVRINSSSKNYIFHRMSCRYVQGEARNGYLIHLDYDVAVRQGYRPCYVCFPEAKKVQKQTDEDDEWELTSESTENTENEVCSKKCTWCKTCKCTRKKPDHVHCSCTVCIQKYTEDLWRDQYDKVPEPSSSTQGPTGKKGSGTLEYMPPHVNTKGNRPAQGGKSGRRGRAAMEPVVEERNESTIPELNERLTQGTPEAEEQPQTYEDTYDMLVDPELLGDGDGRQEEFILSHDKLRAKEHSMRCAAKVRDVIYFYRKPKDSKNWIWCHLVAPEKLGEAFSLKTTKDEGTMDDGKTTTGAADNTVYMLKKPTTKRGHLKQLEKEIPWTAIPEEERAAFRAAEQTQWEEHVRCQALQPEEDWTAAAGDEDWAISTGTIGQADQVGVRFNDSPNAWWQKLKTTITEIEFTINNGEKTEVTQCPLDPCIFQIHQINSDGNKTDPIAYIGIHVDDIQESAPTGDQGVPEQGLAQQDCVVEGDWS
ncbi:secG [Symbiodinium sp. KB8]|nr:secG [Symbiodinium sp. KB8]